MGMDWRSTWTIQHTRRSGARLLRTRGRTRRRRCPHEYGASRRAQRGVGRGLRRAGEGQGEAW
ncbi:MAG: hypothetical protein MZW92_65470 [Comamonadaceae bacterium]|nr:hypothetical protein [Comamonadaceae bacterium]